MYKVCDRWIQPCLKNPSRLLIFLIFKGKEEFMDSSNIVRAVAAVLAIVVLGIIVYRRKKS